MDNLLKSPDELIDPRETEYLTAIHLGLQVSHDYRDSMAVSEILTHVTVTYSYGIRIGVC